MIQIKFNAITSSQENFFKLIVAFKNQTVAQRFSGKKMILIFLKKALFSIAKHAYRRAPRIGNLRESL